MRVLSAIAAGSAVCPEVALSFVLARIFREVMNIWFKKFMFVAANLLSKMPKNN